MAVTVKKFIVICAAFLSASPLSAYSGFSEVKLKPFILAPDQKEKLDENNPIYRFIKREEPLQGHNRRIKLTEHMIELLKLDHLYDENDSFAQVVEKTQKKWLAIVQGKSVQPDAPQRASTERTDLVDSPLQNDLRERVVSIARKMGLFDERKPVLENHRYGAWLGAFLPGVRNNLKNLVQAWENGYHFEKLVVFTGERYLRKEAGELDDIKALCDATKSPLPFKKGWELQEGAKYETEYDMMQLVFEQVELPKDMAAALVGNVQFINAPKGQHARPGTKDCYEIWLKTAPEQGSIIAASYPLLWVGQQISGQTVLGDLYPLETIAPAVSEEEYEKRKSAIVSLIHDTVAKCLYEINEQLKVQL